MGGREEKEQREIMWHLSDGVKRGFEMQKIQETSKGKITVVGNTEDVWEEV